MDMIETGLLARNLLDMHGLNHWHFQWDRAKRRAGCCKSRISTITLSPHYVERNELDDVRDTILHEIAHALAGPGHGHDSKWKEICVKIGARPERCYDNKRIDMPKGRWYAKCKGCQQEFHMHRKPKRNGTRYCRRCGPVDGLLFYRIRIVSESEVLAG